MTRLGFIGFGKMAQAIFEHASATYTCLYYDPYLPAPSGKKIRETLDIATLVRDADIVLLCIKPQTLPEILPTLLSCNWHGKIFISILAGVPLSRFAFTPPPGLVRVMPNTPFQVGAGLSAIAFTNTTAEQEDAVLSLFRAGGEALRVAESHMDTLTGISGSGPAFFYRLAKAAVAIGTDAGLSEEAARLCIAQTLIGAGQMLRQTSVPLDILIAHVTSPGGTTEAGLKEMDLQGVDQAFSNVILKAIIRARALSQLSEG